MEQKILNIVNTWIWETLGCLETSSTDYQLTRRRKLRDWMSEGKNFIAVHQKL
jgi:hypothetical protein